MSELFNNISFHGYASLISFVICFSIAAIGFLQKPVRRLNIIFGIWAGAIGLWSLRYFLIFNQPLGIDETSAYRAMMLPVVFIPALHFHLSLEYLRLAKRYQPLLMAFYAVSLLLAVTVLTPLFFNMDDAGNPYGLPTPMMMYHGFAAFLVASFIFTAIFFAKQAQQSLIRAIEKKLNLQLLFTIGTLGGAISNVCFTYGAPVWVLTFNIIIVLYAVCMVFAISNQRLWHADYLARKFMVFIALTGLFIAGYFGLIYALDYLIGSQRSFHEAIAAFIMFAIGCSIFQPLNEYISEHAIFKRKYYYQKILKDASRGMSRIESLDRLLRLIVHFITMKMYVRNAAVLTRVSDDDHFHLEHQRGYETFFVDFVVENTDPLIEYLQEEREAVDVEKIQECIVDGQQVRVRSNASRFYNFKAIVERMTEMNAACCVPSFLGKELKNVLVLGEKKSGDSYTEADISILFTLAQESAIAIENAGLFDEALKKSKELANINEQLEYSKSLLMKALNETEVANKQLQDTQAQLIHEQKMATLGRLAASVGHEVNNPLTILSMNVSRAILKYRKNPDLRVGEIIELFQKMEQNIGRIKAVVNTLTGLLKRSEKGKFEPLSLKLVLEETLPLVQFQTYLDNLTGTEVEFDIPGNIPLIRGDLERLQEVFLNLFINAYHAMTGKRNRRIQVRAHIDDKNSQLVTIRFEDNGSGMSEETMKKIFNYGFTTKAPGKGSGLGLYMCKYIIELHGGAMRVESNLGEGTTFVLSLPIYEEETSDTDNMKMGSSKND